MDYKKLISNGKSVRDFKEKQVAGEIFSEVKEYIRDSKKLVQDLKIEVKFYSKEEIFDRINNIAGYNGFLINSPSYAIILSENKPRYIENSGYIGEDLILKMRDLGVDSCWITFEDSDLIKDRLGILSDKEVTAIIALGYAENIKKSEKSTGSERLSVEDIVYIDKWNNNANIEELEARGLFEAFSYSRMAPSTLNRQPWRFVVDGGKVILAIRKDELANAYESKIDIGISMLYFGKILDITLLDSRWHIENVDNKYDIPQDYEIVGYCNI